MNGPMLVLIIVGILAGAFDQGSKLVTEWVENRRVPAIVPAPVEEWLCGQGHPHRSEAMAEKCDLLAASHRDRLFFAQVDEWRQETYGREVG